MNALVFMRKDARAGKKLAATGRRRLENAQFLGAAVGLVGGVSAALLGGLFTAAGWFVGNEGSRQWFSVLGTTLLFLTIPLLIFAGYCMDWKEKNTSHRFSNVSRYDDDDEEQ